MSLDHTPTAAGTNARQTSTVAGRPGPDPSRAHPEPLHEPGSVPSTWGAWMPLLLIAALPLVLMTACTSPPSPPEDDEPDRVAALCDPVDQLIDHAARVGHDPDAITDDYRRIADHYEDIAAQLDDPEDAQQLQRLGEVVRSAADDIDEIDPREEVDHITDVSEAAREMRDMIAAHPPIGLPPDAAEQVAESCDPDFAPLTPSG